MMEDNTMIELMIHLMEFGVVIGIAAVVAFTVARHKHEFRSQDPSHAGVAPDSGPDPR